MKFTAEQIAGMIKGRVEGDPEMEVSTIAKIEEAEKGALVFLANPKYAHFLSQTKASVILLSDEMLVPSSLKATLIRVANPYEAFALLMEAYEKTMAPPLKSGREMPSFVAETAKIGADTYIGAFSYIGENVVLEDGAQIYPGAYIGDNVCIGAHSVIHARVSIYPNCLVGKDVIIHSGVVIGADGFGFVPQEDNTFKKVPQLGHVVIGNNVEIGANTTIDRATMGATRIEDNVKIDNLVQIAHNVSIGRNTAIAAQVGISGSTKVGKHCVIGGQAGLAGHIKIADNTRINGQSGVSKSVKEKNTDLYGTPAFAYRDVLKSQAIFKKLPELSERIKALEKQIDQLFEEN